MAKKKAPSKTEAVPPVGALHGGRFVALSDLHLHPWAAFSKGDGAQNTRLRRALAILDLTLARAQELEVPWVFGGDIVHTAGYTLNVVLAELTEILLRYPGVPKLAVWGNHDARGVGGRIELAQTVWGSLVRTVPGLVVLDPSLGETPYTDPVSGLTFSGTGYQPRADLVTLAAPSDVGIYHQTVRGTKTPNGFALEEGVSAEELLSRHRLVLVGHVHHWQVHTRAEGKVLLIPGSPEHQNFGDKEERGWWVIDVPAGPLELAPVPTITATGCADGVLEFVDARSPQFLTVPTPRHVLNDGHFYRVESANGEAVPDGAIVVAPEQTVVEHRHALRGLQGTAILETWMKVESPPEGAQPREYVEVGEGLLRDNPASRLVAARLVRVQLRNFCSYESAELPVSAGVRLVLGHGRDYPSNGAGKSTLFEAMFWALFGRTTKGLTGDEVIRRGADSCSVRLDLQTDDGSSIVVTRLRGKKSALVVETVDGVLEGKSVGEVTEKLGKFLGITPELYLALAYFSQERLMLFASASDGERKDMLADLIGLAGYQLAAAAAQKQVSECAAVRSTAETLRAAADMRLRDESRRHAELETLSEEWQETRRQRIQAIADAMVEFTSSAVGERAKLVASAEERLSAAVREQGKKIGARLKESEGARTGLGGATRAMSEAEADLLVAETRHVASLQFQATKRELEAAQSRRSTVEKKLAAQGTLLRAGVCPVCKQPVKAETGDDCLSDLRADAEQEEELIRALMQKASEELQEHQAAVAQLAAAKSEVTRVTTVTRLTNDIAALREQLTNVQQHLSALRGEAEAEADRLLDERRSALQRQAKALQQTEDPHAGELRGTAERVAAAEHQVEEHLAAREEAARQSIIYEYWQKGFSKQGIQSLLVDEVAAMFNQARGRIFPALTQGVYDVQFCTMSQTKAGEWRERSDFLIHEHGQLVPYAALSGGQRRRIDVGVMLTLVKAVSQWMQVPGVLGLLVLDEVFGFLDASGAEGLMEALREVQEQIPSIFAVAHDAHLQSLFPETVVVVQDAEGISRIEQ